MIISAIKIIGGIIALIWLISRFATYNYVMYNLSNIIEELSTDKVRKDYKKRKRKFYNSDGNISASAKKDIKANIQQLNNSCQFYSRDFYHHYRHNRPILKIRITKLINSYIKKSATIKISNNFNNITPEQFFKLRKTISGDMVGVYVLYNKDRKMYYVGQATRLFFRVNQHFTGHGNGDVYGDYKRGGDHFTIKLIALANSGYYDLDRLEKDLITKYDAFNKGYNKTNGNG